MGKINNKEIFTLKPWLNDARQNVKQLKKILKISDYALPEIKEGDEGKYLTVSGGKYVLSE